MWVKIQWLWYSKMNKPMRDEKNSRKDKRERTIERPREILMFSYCLPVEVLRSLFSFLSWFSLFSSLFLPTTRIFHWEWAWSKQIANTHDCDEMLGWVLGCGIDASSGDFRSESRELIRVEHDCCKSNAISDCATWNLKWQSNCQSKKGKRREHGVPLIEAWHNDNARNRITGGEKNPLQTYFEKKTQANAAAGKKRTKHILTMKRIAKRGSLNGLWTTVDSSEGPRRRGMEERGRKRRRKNICLEKKSQKKLLNNSPPALAGSGVSSPVGHV